MHRLENFFEDAQIKLSSVVTDLRGICATEVSQPPDRADLYVVGVSGQTWDMPERAASVASMLGC